MATAHINGIDINYEDSAGDGPAILFSHGFLLDHTMFDDQVAYLADRYRCIKWDQRGLGATRAPGPFTYWDSAADAVGLLDHLGIDRAVFVGMSQGGFLGLRAALLHTARVSALVLIASAADSDDEATLDGYRGMLHVIEHGSDEEREGVFAIVAGLILGDEALASEWIPKWRALDRTQLTTAGGALLGRDDVSDRMGEITCPVLAVHGTADQAISLDRAHALAAALPDHRGVIEVEGAAHAPNMTNPDQVNAAIAAFLEAL